MTQHSELLSVPVILTSERRGTSTKDIGVTHSAHAVLSTVVQNKIFALYGQQCALLISKGNEH
jgi:hypothetical protein